MSFKLSAKTYLLAVLDKLPPSTGFKLYHFFQNRFQTKTLQEKIKSSYGSYLQFKRLTFENDISVKEKTILEIGSGWLPLMPYFFKYHAGAQEVKTYDLNQHYDPKMIKTLNLIFLDQYSFIVKEAGNRFHLPTGIKYFPQTDLAEEEVIDADIVFSRFVMEHVEPESIKKMHRQFKKKLRPGSYIIHLISPSDHRAYVDKSLSLQDFLRFSEKEWKNKQTKFDYHNRLRLPEYLQMFRELGFEIVHKEFEVPHRDSASLKKFKEVPLHKDYQQFSEEELMAGSINLILKV